MALPAIHIGLACFREGWLLTTHNAKRCDTTALGEQRVKVHKQPQKRNMWFTSLYSDTTSAQPLYTVSRVADAELAGALLGASAALDAQGRGVVTVVPRRADENIENFLWAIEPLGSATDPVRLVMARGRYAGWALSVYEDHKRNSSSFYVSLAPPDHPLPTSCLGWRISNAPDSEEPALKSTLAKALVDGCKVVGAGILMVGAAALVVAGAVAESEMEERERHRRRSRWGGTHHHHHHYY